MKTIAQGVAKDKAVVLIMNVMGDGFGGQETHVLSLYKELLSRGYQPLLLVLADTPLQRYVLEAGLSCYAIPYRPFRGYYRILNNLILPIVLAWLCKWHHVKTIHCNHRFEIRSALLIARVFQAKVILNYHVSAQIDAEILIGVRAFIAPSRAVVRNVLESDRICNLGIPEIRVMPPLFDAEKFMVFRSGVERHAWFQGNFGITLKSCPIICTIGNMVQDLSTKNYPLLFEAMAFLIRDKKILLQGVLVGDGPMRQYLENLARALDIEDYVHFLGFTSEHIPGVLYHSDAFVLASSTESFGIVYLEAALMGKASIGARATGAEDIIVDGESGFLFANGDRQSLACAIERLVCDPVLAHRLGVNAYEHVTKNFLPSVVIPQYEALYASLQASDR